MDDELVEKVARAVRVDQFSRTRRSGRPDADTPLTEREVADAQAAIAAVLEHLSAVTPEMVEAGAAALYERDVAGWQSKHPNDFFLAWDEIPLETFKGHWRDEAKDAYLSMLAQVKP